MSTTHKIITTETIAKEVLGFHTLETRNRDQLDFREVHVGAMYGALRLAYLAGAQHANHDTRSLEETFDVQMLELAHKHFGIKSFEQKNSDRLDFHDTAVWCVKAALEESYDLGSHAPAPSQKHTGPSL